MAAETRSMLQRASAVLAGLRGDGSPASLAELTTRSGLPRSTVHRIATELCGLGLLRREGEGYVAGTALWELGERAPVARRLREAALPALTDLYDATGENAHLAVLVDGSVLYLAKASGSRAVPTLSQVGLRHPPHATGPGRALLAELPDPQLEAFLAGPLEALTKHTLTDPRRLRAELERTRERGYAVARQEVTLGNISLAVALRPRTGLPPAAVGLVSHLAAEESRLVPLLRRAATSIENALDTSSH